MFVQRYLLKATIRFLICLTCGEFSFSYAADHQAVNYQFDLLSIEHNQGILRGQFSVRQQPVVIEENVTVDLQDFNHTGFQTYLLPALNALDPLSGVVPENVGHAKKRFECNFHYRGSLRHYEGIDPRPEAQHALQASWQYQSDRDRHETSASLVFKINVDHVVHNLAFPAIHHTLTHTAPEVLVGRHFDGETVYPMRVALQTWLEPKTRETYQRQAFLRDGDIYPGSRVIYVKPFVHDGVLQLGNCIGTYIFDRDLTEAEKDKKIDENGLLFSDGARIYLPKVKQELWRRDNLRVRFCIVSYEASPLHFITSALIGHVAPIFPEGLYEGRRGVFAPDGDRSIEIWTRLNSEPLEEFQISVPRELSSVPGMYL